MKGVMMKFLTIAFLALTSLSLFAGTSYEHKKEKMEERTDEATSDLGRGVKSTSRKVQDETCQMVNGKMDCAVKKTKHSIQNGADKVEDAID
jgi:uncharacterized protein YjbJ (UPF0337 family)